MDNVETVPEKRRKLDLVENTSVMRWDELVKKCTSAFIRVMYTQTTLYNALLVSKTDKIWRKTIKY